MMASGDARRKLLQRDNEEPRVECSGTSPLCRGAEPVCKSGSRLRQRERRADETDPVAGQTGFLQGFQAIGNNPRIDTLKMKQRAVERIAEGKQFIDKMAEPAMAVEEELDPGG